ncbi:TonB-dependent siderophore receptor PiuA [Aurantivibrio infirmus]
MALDPYTDYSQLRTSARTIKLSDSSAIADSTSRKPARTALSVAISTVILGLTSTAMAQQATNNKQNDPSIEEIIINSERDDNRLSSRRFVRPLVDTAQTVNVVTSELLEARGASTLRDALRNSSGISMQAGEGGTPAGDQLSIRGFSSRTDIFIDNVRDFGGYTRDPFNLEQIEVVKGPSSDYSGRGSTGGSVNLVSKTPRLADSMQMNLSAGSDSFSRLTVDANAAIPGTDSSAARLNVLYHDQDVSNRDEVSNSRWGIAPSLAFGIDTATQVSISFFHLSQDNVPDYGIPWVPASNVPLSAFANEAPPVDFNNWYGLLERDFEETKTTLATLRLDQQISDNFSFRNTTRVGRTDRNSMITAPRFISTDSTDIRRSDEKYRDQEDGIVSNQSDFNLTLNSGDVEHKILFGFEIAQEGEKRYTQALTGIDSPSTDLFSPNPNDPYLENYQRTGGLSETDSSTIAAYLSDSIQLNAHWQLNASIRWDRFSLEYRPDGAELLDRTDKMLSYRAGIVYKPARNGSIYFGYGTSFNPTAEGLQISTSSRTPNIAELDPEENETFEIGTKWELLDRRVLVSAAVFQTLKTNARTQVERGEDLVLEGEHDVRGIELGFVGSISDKWQIYAGYTHMESEVVDSKNIDELGNQLSNTPENSMNFWSSYQVIPSVKVGLGTLYVDDRFSNNANTRSAPSYWVHEASMNYIMNEKINFQLNIQNLTDEKYIDYVGGGHFIPGTGRTILLSSHFKF